MCCKRSSNIDFGASLHEARQHPASLCYDEWQDDGTLMGNAQNQWLISVSSTHEQCNANVGIAADILFFSAWTPIASSWHRDRTSKLDLAQSWAQMGDASDLAKSLLHAACAPNQAFILDRLCNAGAYPAHINFFMRNASDIVCMPS